MAEGAQALLESIGFSGRRLTDTLGNEKILHTLLEVLKEVRSSPFALCPLSRELSLC